MLVFTVLGGTKAGKKLEAAKRQADLAKQGMKMADQVKAIASCLLTFPLLTINHKLQITFSSLVL